MTKSDPLGFDISVSAAKRNKPRTRRGMSGASETSTQLCNHEGCNAPGKFRAPKSPDALDDFYWFCQQHAREYNLKWNFFNGTTEAEMAVHASRDKLRAQKKRLINDPETRAWARLGIQNPHQVLGANATQNPGCSRGGGRKLPPTERRAIEILEARADWSKAEIRKTYKKLIKVLHPDMNGGDRSQEEQLQEIVWAWDQIRDSRNFK
ncbi:MAG: DnaJ domain-containing protein [Rhodobacteraceae bacterium]|nr:DnaJ domain-containing protein [Paracoccaceae bacterium]